MTMLFIGILTLFWGQLEAQFKVGYPTTGTIAPSAGGDWYTDDTRASVMLVVRPGFGDHELHLDPGHNHGSGSWASGDRAMLVQMKTMDGATTGRYVELEVSSYSNNTLFVEPNTGLFTDQTLHASTRLQVIRIPRALVIELDRVKVKCREWDGNTGGVLCFASGSTKITKSIITAAGCGFGPENVTFGKGGNGAPGDNFYDGLGGGEEGLYDEPCLEPEPASQDKHPGTLGIDGDPQQTTGAVSGTSGVIGGALTYGLPNPSMDVVKMGNAGYTETTSNSGGIGGYGGGHGGEGGLNGNGDPNTLFGSSGEPGDDGGKGGDAGQGAKGGGIILIKTMYFEDDISFTQFQVQNWLDASGAPGENGKPGQTGGKGGSGGYGGVGFISGNDVYYSGGSGGNGEAGDAAGGGDGSQGGAPGTILLRGNPSLGGKPHFFNLGGSISYTSVWINLSTGSNGAGGRGAYKHSPDPTPVFMLDGIGGVYEYCESGPPIDPPVGVDAYANICDCDLAMYPFEIFGSSSSPTNDVVNGIYLLEDATNAPDWELLYDRGNGKLISIDHHNEKKYHCRFHPVSSANPIMAFLLKYNQNNLSNLVDLPATKESLTGSDYKLIFKDADGIVSATYYSLESTKDRYILYENSPSGSYRADYSRCFPPQPEREEAGETSFLDRTDLEAGPDGTTPHNPTFSGTTSDHFDFDVSTALIAPDNNRDGREFISIRHNSDNNVFLIEDIRTSDDDNEFTQTNIEMTIVLRDIQGREVARYSSYDNAYKLDLSAFSAGVYLLQVTKGEIQTVQKIIVR